MNFNFKNKEQKITQAAKYIPGKRHLSKVYWYFLLTLILTPFIYLGYKIFTDTFIRIGSAHVKFDEKIIRATNDGYVKEVFLQGNDKVKKKQILVVIYNQNMESDLKHLENELETYKTRKEKLLRDPEIERLKHSKKEAEAHLARVTEYRNIQETLRKKGVSTIWIVNEANKDFDDATQRIGEISRKIEEETQERKLLLETDIDKGIKNTENEIEKLKASLDYLKVVSPEDGTIANIYVNEGEFIRKGQKIAHLVTKINLRIVVYLKARHFSEQIKKGQKVTIILPDNTKIPGIVSEDPIIAKNEPNASTLVRSEKRMIMIRVVPIQNFPESYKIYNLPVEVFF